MVGRYVRLLTVISILALTPIATLNWKPASCREVAETPVAPPFTSMIANSSGVLIFKVYPDGFVGISGSVEAEARALKAAVATVPPKIPTPPSGAAFMLRIGLNLTSRPVNGTVRQEVEGFVRLPDVPDPKVRELLDKMMLNLSFRGHGDRNETWRTASLNFSLHETVELSLSLSLYENVVEKANDLNVTVAITLHYKALNLTKHQVQDIMMLWPLISGMVEVVVAQASDGLIKVSVDLEDYIIGDESATLFVKARARGDFIEGLRRIIEKPLAPEIPFTPPSPVPPPEIPEEARLFLYTMLGLMEARYSWIVESEGHMGWLPRDGVFAFEGYTIYGGDPGEQFKWSWAALARLQLELMAKTGVENRNLKLMLAIYDLIVNSEFNVDWLSYSVDVNPDKGYLKAEFSGLRVKPRSPEDLLSLLSLASMLTPSKMLTVVVQGSSDAEKMVEVEIPLEVEEEIAKPVSIEGRHKISWVFENLGALDKLRFIVKPNVVGVVDFNYVELKKTVAGVEYTIRIYTNSSVIGEPRLVDSRLEVNVSGIERVSAALNVTIPKPLMDGVILVFIDGEVVEAGIGYSAEEYSVYVAYTHSLRRIEVAWAKPYFTILLDKEEVNVGGEIAISGSLRVLDKPLAGERVVIMLNGVEVAEARTDGDGRFNVKLKMEEEGEYMVKAVYRFADLTFESNEKMFKVVLAWHQNPYILTGIAALAIAIIAAILILRR